MRKVISGFILTAILASYAWASTTYTSHYNLAKPSDGSTSWGSSIRDNLDTIDTQLYVNSTTTTNHVSDTTGAHAATSISTTTGASTCTSADDVQEFLDCLDSQFGLVIGGAVVTLTGTQTITGDKTFTGTTTFTAPSTLSIAGTLALPNFGDGLLHNTSGVATSSLLVNADVSPSAAIARSKIAAGTADHVVIHDGSGLLSSEAQLSVTRGGTGIASGTSGGIPYFSSSTSMGSSDALPLNSVIVGGGAGAAPSPIPTGTPYQALRIPSGGGAPAFGALDISQSAAVTGVLSQANGGLGTDMTGASGILHMSGGGSTASAVALNSSDTSGFLPVNKGGTGAVTAASAINSISPLTTTGDTIYYDSANHQRLAGNTSTTKKYLSQTGNGSASAAPAWSQPAFSEVSGTVALNQGGTGQTTKAAAFDALSPNTTTGDITYYNGSTNSRLAAGATNQYLKISGGVPTWSTVNASSGNKLDNGGFESGTSSWTASGGSFTTTTTAANVVEGTTAGVWDSSASAQTLSFTAVTSGGSAGTNGEFTCRIQTPSGTATHLMELYDGSNVIASTTITSSTNFATTTINFSWPSSATSVTARLKSVASNEPSINIDDCYLGSARNIGSAAQATIYGTMTMPGGSNCTWLESTSSGENNYVAISTSAASCAQSWTATGGVTAPAGTDYRPTLTNMPPGEYEVTISTLIISSAAGVCSFRISDGTNTYYAGTHYNNGDPSGETTMTAYIPVASAQTKTYSIEAADGHAGACGLANDQAGRGVRWVFKRFPSSSETAYRPELLNWKVDASIAGANPSLGTASVSSYSGITDASLTLTNNSGTGNITAQIPCSTTNAPTGTTCSVGSESVGVSFNLPLAGDVRACASFTHGVTTAAVANSGGGATFQVVETPSNAQTISQEGKDRANTYIVDPANTAMGAEWPVKACGTFTFTSAGQKTLRLMYEQAVQGSGLSASDIKGDQYSGLGQRDIHWEVYPINQMVPAPVLIGSVTSGSTGPERVERATFTCSGSSSISSQSGSWLSSIGNISSGACTLNFATGTFSSTPTCAFIYGASQGTSLVTFNLDSITPSAATVHCRVVSSGSSTQSDCGSFSSGNLMCMGPR